MKRFVLRAGRSPACQTLVVMMNTTKQMIRVLMMSVLFVACGTSEKIVSFKKKSSETGIYEFDLNGTAHKVLDNDSTTYTLKSKPSITIEKFELLEISDECYAGEICVDFKFNDEGTKEYTALTERNLNNQIFYVIDGVVISDPNVMGVINDGMGQFPIKYDENKWKMIESCSYDPLKNVWL